MNPNMKAFLDMIAISELGKDLISLSDNGYNVIVGSTKWQPILFHSYNDHPRRKIWLPHLNVWSTAAGRYQIIKKNYDIYKVRLGLPDFSPPSQDRIAFQLIRECKATTDIIEGRVDSAIYMCRSRWASFPSAGYGQHEHKIETLLAAYTESGGVVA